jgi:hypothetical protein
MAVRNDFTAGEVLAAADLNDTFGAKANLASPTFTGTVTIPNVNLGSWIAYTPTVSGTGWAIGNGLTIGEYVQIGKQVNFTAGIFFGSTSTFGAGGLEVSLPVACTVVNFTCPTFAVDTSLGNYYYTPSIFASSTTVKPQAIQSNIGLIQEIISTKPFTWDNTDSLFISGTYEAA